MIFQAGFYLFVLIAGAAALALGLAAGWIDRKVTARLQWRQGPPWYQPFADIVKLMGKEIIVPAGADKFSFFAAPLMGFSAVFVGALLVSYANLWPEKSFLGDIIVAVYLLMIPAISLITGAAASRNPLASLGASREIKLMLAYELPFLLALLVPVIKTQWSLSLGNILQYQAQHGAILSSGSGFLAFAVMMLCAQAKLGLTPFDMSEAETEIMGGVLVEYSGALLALFKLTKAMLLFVVPLFVITVFWGGIAVQGAAAAAEALKYVVLLVIIIIIKNTNPRVRIDQALRFFWGPAALAALLAVVLAVLGV